MTTLPQSNEDKAVDKEETPCEECEFYDSGFSDECLKCLDCTL